MKAHNLEIPGWVEVCNFADDYDPRPAEYRNDLRYKSWFQNICLSYPGISKTTIFQTNIPTNIKVALGVFFALKSWKEYLLLFTYLIALGKDVTLPLITKFKTNKCL